MQWTDLDFQPTNRKLRQFAVLLLLFASVLEAIYVARYGLSIVVISAWIVLTLIAVVGLIRPAVIRWLFISASVVTFPIGWLLLHVLLAIVFLGLVTPWGIVLRCFGRDALQRRKPAESSTYWQPRSPVTDLRRYFRQY